MTSAALAQLALLWADWLPELLAGAALVCLGAGGALLLAGLLRR